MARGFTIATSGAWGFTTEKGEKQVVTRIPQEAWTELKARAIKERTSMQEKIKDYIRVGLEVDRDWDTDEPDRHT